MQPDDKTVAKYTTLLEQEIIVLMDTPEEVASVGQIQEHIPSQGLYHAMFLFCLQILGYCTIK